MYSKSPLLTPQLQHQGGETDLTQRIDSDVTNMNTISKSFILFHVNLNVLLHVLYKIINKMYVKTEIAQNDTDLSCIKLDINVSKCYAFVKHFETLHLYTNNFKYSAF